MKNGSISTGTEPGAAAAAAAAPGDGRAARRLLYVVSEDWYFLMHRLPMARAARDAGFEVHVATHVATNVATNVGTDAAAIEAENFVLHPVPFARGRMSPLASAETIRALRRVHRAVKPDIVHHVSLQPIVLGLIAALGSGVASVNAFTGLGYLFTASSSKAKAARQITQIALRFLLDRNRTISLVENRDDFAVLASLGIPQSRIALIDGSGVDVRHFLPLAEPPGPPTIGFAGRLLEHKGIRTLIAAHGLLQARGAGVRLLIAGTPDPANPASVTAEQVAAWAKAPGTTWLGQVADIRTLWARAQIAILPSRGGEGVPLALLEAAACGRPMIATAAPGCREIVIQGETGLLVPIDDAAALADAIVRLSQAPALRAQFGAAARRLVETRFSADIVGPKTVELYCNLLAP
jgi:glycosyltransferase involved in cell wall biosynthesis